MKRACALVTESIVGKKYMRKLLHEGSGHLKEARGTPRRWHDEGNAGGISRDEEAFASLNDAISVYRKMRVLACKTHQRKLRVEQLWTETLGARAVAGGTPLMAKGPGATGDWYIDNSGVEAEYY